MHKYYVQVKFTALRRASASSVTFESCLVAVDDPESDFSTGWMQAHIKCDLPCSSLAKLLPWGKQTTTHKATTPLTLYFPKLENFASFSEEY